MYFLIHLQKYFPKKCNKFLGKDLEKGKRDEYLHETQRRHKGATMTIKENRMCEGGKVKMKNTTMENENGKMKGGKGGYYSILHCC